MRLSTWPFYIAYSLDLLANAVAGGSPCETLSSRCYRLNSINRTYHVLEVILNVIAYPVDGKDHCKQSYRCIVEGTYMPNHFYDKANS